jgi:hypothetical protein
MPRPVRAFLVLLSAAFLEVGWVVSVRLVHLGQAAAVAAVAMTMQAVVYFSLLAVVDDRRLAVAGILGAGVGALVGMALPLSGS